LLLPGAFYEDGLADVADELAGSYDRLRALEIMEDLHVGAFGAIVLVLTLLTNVALLALLRDVSADLMCRALFTAYVVSRTWPLLTIGLVLHVSDAQTPNRSLWPIRSTWSVCSPRF